MAGPGSWSEWSRTRLRRLADSARDLLAGPMTMGLGRLNRSISLAILGASATVMILFGVVLYPYEMTRMDARVREAGELMSAVYQDKREELANEIFDRKIMALDRSLVEIMSFSGIMAASVYDLDGRLLRTTHPGEVPVELSVEERAALSRGATMRRKHFMNRDAVAFAVSIEEMGERVGYLTLHYGLADIQKETRLTMVGFFVLLLTLLLLMALLLTILLRRWVVRPLAQLSDAIGQVQAGRLGEQAPISGRDEMADVAVAFNAMSTALKEAVDAQRNYSSQLQSINVELADKAAELERANRRLLEIDKLKSSFLSSVSHELRTPLTSVRGFAKLIRRDFERHYVVGEQRRRSADRLSGRIMSNLEIINEESERLSNMVNDFLDLARIESGRMQWRDSEVRVDRLVERAMAVAAGLFSEKADVRLECHVQEDLPVLCCDEERLLQVCINLLSNAVKFTHEGLVAVQARRADNGWVRISVSDEGVGIPTEDLSSIFDAFHQAAHGDLLASKPKGTGLGLAISSQIVAHYRGRIWAESELGVGSVFHVEMPLSECGLS